MHISGRMDAPNRATDDDVRALASDAVADPRTIVRVLAGLPVRPTTDTRIRRALLARGITPPPPAAPNPNRAA
jgi:hypothetical protein